MLLEGVTFSSKMLLDFAGDSPKTEKTAFVVSYFVCSSKSKKGRVDCASLIPSFVFYSFFQLTESNEPKNVNEQLKIEAMWLLAIF